jgi:hypothetical protein
MTERERKELQERINLIKRASRWKKMFLGDLVSNTAGITEFPKRYAELKNPDAGMELRKIKRNQKILTDMMKKENKKNVFHYLSLANQLEGPPLPTSVLNIQERETEGSELTHSVASGSKGPKDMNELYEQVVEESLKLQFDTR